MCLDAVGWLGASEPLDSWTIVMAVNHNVLRPFCHMLKKVKVEHLLQRPFAGKPYLRGAQVHGARQAASHIPALCLMLSSTILYNLFLMCEIYPWMGKSLISYSFQSMP